MCNPMGEEWEIYYRIVTRAHTLEARLAKGGEPIGDELRPRVAKKGEWICRNPVNGYIWSVNEEDFYDLYRSINYKAGHDQKKKKTKKMKQNKSSASNESSRNENLEIGPLFD